MSANTETSVERREARTTDAETAAFIDRTEESLTTKIYELLYNIKSNRDTLPFMHVLGLCCGIVGEKSVQQEEGGSQSPYGVG